MSVAPLRRRRDLASLFVGPVVPDSAQYRSEAFSRAAILFIDGLLKGLAASGLTPSGAVSFFPIPSFPRSRALWFGRRSDVLPSGIPVVLVPFVNLTPLKQASIGLSTFWEILKWGWRERRARHRVLYCYNLIVPPAPFLLAGAFFARAHAVVSLNDIPEPGETVPNTALWRFNLLLHRWLVPWFRGLVVVSDAIAHDFAPGRPYVRVEGGIGANIVERLPEQHRASVGDGTFTIVATGKLAEVNGIEQVIDAFRLLDGPWWRLKIAGAGPLENRVREAAAADPRIVYLGFLGFEEVLSLYSTADVLVNMRVTRAIRSRYFFPSKLMEYLASGTPVISTCTGHVADEFRPYLFPLQEESPQALAHMIRAVAALPPRERCEMGRRARAFMIAQKTWEAQGARIVEYITSYVLAGEGPNDTPRKELR